MAPAPTKRKARVCPVLTSEELALRQYWAVRYVGTHLGVGRDVVIRTVTFLIETNRFTKGDDYLLCMRKNGGVNRHFLINKDSGIRKIKLAL